MAPDDILTQLVGAFVDSSALTLGRLLPVTLALFVALTTVQTAWDLLIWALVDTPNFVGLAVRRLVVVLFFTGLIIGLPSWLPPVLQGFEVLGERVTGQPGAMAPVQILGQGIALTLSMHDSWREIVVGVMPIVGAFRSVTTLAVFVAYCLIALQMVRILVEGSLVLGGLSIFLAGAGSRVTFGLTEGYLQYAVDVGIRSYLVLILVATGQNLAATWDSLVQQQTLLELFDLRLHLFIAASAVIFAAIVWLLPASVSRRLSQSFRLSGGRTPLDPPG